MQVWPFWAGALALAAIAVAVPLLTGRPFGVSGLVGNLVAGRAEAAGRRGASALFLLGIVGGGAVAALTGGGGLHLTAAADAAHAHFFGGGLGGLGVLFGGGILVGLGTALAGGCTSGHGLVGCARLQPGSLVATAAFFGTAVAVSFGLLALGGAP